MTLKLAWSIMWNITDETEMKGKNFLNGRGMQYFIKCLHTFQHREELRRNMMALLGNHVQCNR